MRHSLGRDPEKTAFLVFAPLGTSLADFVLAADTRWAIERCFQESKSELGLDQYEVRTWRGWHRHITLVMAAYALLVTLHQRQLKKNSASAWGGLGPSLFHWPNGAAGCVSPLWLGHAAPSNRPCSGSPGAPSISALPSSITGPNDSKPSEIPSLSP